MEKITASEISVYLTCARAWGYSRTGVTQRNRAELMAGIAYHQSFGNRAHGTRRVKRVLTYGLILLLILLALLIAAEVWR